MKIHVMHEVNKIMIVLLTHGHVLPDMEVLRIVDVILSVVLIDILLMHLTVNVI